MAEERARYDGKYTAEEVVRLALPSLRLDPLTATRVWRWSEWLMAEGFILAHGGDCFSFTEDGKKALDWKERSIERG